MDDFAALQQSLGPALAANRRGSTTPHVMIALPSYSVSESLLSHYGDRIPSLEHRYLNAIVVGGRIESCEMLYVLSRAPGPEILDYYMALLPPRVRDSTRARTTIFEVTDRTTRSVAQRLLDRPDLIAAIRERIAGRPAFIEPWNVTEHEVALALALGVPINGTDPSLRPLAFKGAGRRLFRDVGVPTPLGREEVRTVDDVVDAVRWIGRQRPLIGGVVIKHDDSGAGDGNVVLDLRRMHHAADPGAWLREQVEALPAWYLGDLMRGGVVEERIAGSRFTSPSAQVDIRPSGEVVVLATHEQVLGGDGGQVYMGCRFPADPAYAPLLAEHAAKIGARLQRDGAIGRFSVDFVAAAGPGAAAGAAPATTPAATPGGPDPSSGAWDVYAIEINLRKGGTTHPYAALRNLAPGRYDVDAGLWITDDGSVRAYSSSDNIVDERWLNLPPAAVIRAVADAGLQFDPSTRVGTVLHMLSGLGVDGRFGATAIAPSPVEADAMFDQLKAVVGELRGPLADL